MALDVVKLRALQAPYHPEIALPPEMSLSSMEQKKDRRAVDSAIAGKHTHLRMCVITCELDPKTIEIARRYFAQSPHRDKIQIRQGRAADTLKTLQGPFDLCFIDADKPSYDYYYDRCVIGAQGGLIVLDNMLRYGRVLNPTEEDARIVNLLMTAFTGPASRKRAAAVSRRHHARVQIVTRP